MPVRISTRASFEASHSERRDIFRVAKHCGHHHTHVQLGSQGVHVHDEIRRVTDKAVPELLRSGIA
jgi:hypothetical protein